MKTFFNAVALIALFLASFFYTEKVAIVVKDMDKLMIEIKDKSENYNTSYIPAIISDNTIIPGINGLVVDIDRSYVKMKKYGVFDPNLFEYSQLEVENKLSDNLDKFIIGGNNSEREVSLVFTVTDENYVEEVLKILKDNNVEASFFLDGNYLENNLEILETFNNSNHTLGNLSYNNDYLNPSYVWIDTVIKRLTDQVKTYCLAFEKNQDIINTCKLYNSYTVMPSIYTEKNPLYTVRKSIKSGSIIVMPINSSVKDELGVIISSINSMGYKLVNLEILLDETK